MFIVLAASTNREVILTENFLKKNRNIINGVSVEIVITGVGGIATTYSLIRQIFQKRPACIIQAGIGGSFSIDHSPGSLVFIDEEIQADLGGWKTQQFEDVFDLQLMQENDFPFTNKKLVNPSVEVWRKYNLPFVRGISVNAIISDRDQQNTVLNKYSPVIESMEGAAFHYVCLMENIPFIQLRAVSNFAGERNKGNWKISESMALLNEKLISILSELPELAEISNLK